MVRPGDLVYQNDMAVIRYTVQRIIVGAKDHVIVLSKRIGVGSRVSL